MACAATGVDICADTISVATTVIVILADHPLGGGGMEPIERSDNDAFESRLAQLLLQSPAHKCGLIRRGIREHWETMELSLQKDLRIQHIRLSKADGPASLQ